MRIRLTLVLLAASAATSHGQASNEDIFLVSLSRAGGKLTASGARNLTNRPGYDKLVARRKHLVFHRSR